ncbi:hypothetical protein VTO73DRAFT_12045 [Trametes versicolor]
MGTTVLVELQDFIRDVLPAIPVKQPQATLPEKTVNDAQDTLSKLFYDKSNKLVNVKEDNIADVVVKVINDAMAALELPKEVPRRYRAKLSRYKVNPSDTMKGKVDAAIYERDDAPVEDWPDWTHCRFYIEFKRGDIKYDPWDDRSSKDPENERKTRAVVRAQLIAYAKNVFLHQHRTALFSLLIIGSSFRVARWDRSGVIVSKKVSYLKDPRALLDLVCHLVQLHPTLQGLDPTATLIKPGTKAFRIMNELAQPNSAQDMEYMVPGTEHYIPPPAHPPPTAPSPDQAPVSSGTAAVSTPPQQSIPAAMQTKTRAQSKRPARTKVQAAEDSSKELPEAEEDPDDDLPDIIEIPGKDLRIFRYVREKFRHSIADDLPRYKLTIKVGNKDRVFLVGWPIFESPALFGRATRGYVAIDASTRRFVFLKDSWRPFYEGVQQEGFYLEKFADDDDIVVPTLVCHGDVEQQRAFTAQYEEGVRKQMEATRRREELSANASSTLDAEPDVNSKKRPLPVENDSEDVFSQSCVAEDVDVEDVKGTLRHHIHYRMAVKDVCLPFSMFRNTEQLIYLMTNCIETHYYVYQKHKLLHRDISAGNVLILPRLVMEKDGTEVVEWRGVLTDWELAKPCTAENTTEKARQPERTGTWQFMSVAYVESQWTKPITIADELESFFHVMLFWAIRFLPQTLLDTTQFVIDYFDTFRSEADSKYSCGATKYSVMTHGALDLPPFQFVQNSREPGSPLNRLIDKLLKHFQARYAILKDQPTIQQKPSSGIDLSEMIAARPRIKLRDGTPAWRIGRVTPPGSSSYEVAGKRPTQATKDRAELLNTHHKVLELFDDIRFPTNTDPAEWATVWVVQDQLVNYEPRIILANNVVPARTTGTRGSENGSNKRPRNAGSNLAFSSNQLPETTSSWSVLSNSGQTPA